MGINQEFNVFEYIDSFMKMFDKDNERDKAILSGVLLGLNPLSLKLEELDQLYSNFGIICIQKNNEYLLSFE